MMLTTTVLRTLHRSAAWKLRVQCLSRAMSSVRDRFVEHGIVPDVLDTPPNSLAEVQYDSGVNAELGNTLTPTQVQNQPKVTYPTEKDAKYTLVLTDPDAPSRKDPKWGEWKHFVVANIPGSDVAKGEVLSEYIGSGPPEGTGLHRYIWLVYKQPEGVKFAEVLQGLSTKGRNNWKAKEFAAKYGLGDPVAGNFYQAEYDDYVPKLYAKLD